MSDSTVIRVDEELGSRVVHPSEFSTGEIRQALVQQHPEVAALIRWTVSTQGDVGSSRQGTIFSRDRYVTPGLIFQQFATAQDAVASDDIVSGVADSTESLAFGKIDFFSQEQDEEDVWNQIAFDIDLDARIREMWRELFTVSQFTACTWWGQKSYRVRGRSTTGVKRKRQFTDLVVPLGITILDPLKCVPADTLIWTKDGPTRMGDLEVGQHVWSTSGNAVVQAPVVRKVATGTKPILRITTSNHSLRVTPEHPVLCLQKEGSRFGPRNVQFVWKEASTIRRGDVLVGLSKFNETFQTGESPSPEAAYVLGLASGDGGRNSRIGRTNEDRFWDLVQRDSANDCWLWTGARTGNGVPSFHLTGESGDSQRTVLPHRYAWFADKGENPDGNLRRLCPSRLCVNPAHFVDKPGRTYNYYVFTPHDVEGVRNGGFRLYPATSQAASWTAAVEAELGCEVHQYPHTSAGCVILQFSAPALARWAKFMRRRCTDRRFPDWLWSASRDVRLAFLRGFLEADGYEAKQVKGTSTAWSWRLANRWMAEDARSLAASVGWGVTSIWREHCTSMCDGRLLSGWSWKGFAYEDTERRPVPTSFDHHGRHPIGEHLLARTVTSVEQEDPEPVWDIEVAGTHNFIAEGIVVHNCVPVGNLMFNQEQLAYLADRSEVDLLDAAVLNDPQADPISRQIIVAKYSPADYERRNLAKIGINAEFLYVLNPKNCWRHTVTRSQYRRFAEVRMKSIFEILDQKHQLRQMDRANLIGGTNFILLVRKGTDHWPAKPDEIANLQSQVATVAQVPILVGDHRLDVKIVTPAQDHTLSSEKYGTLDSRITTRLYQMFLVHGGAGSIRSDDSVKLAKVISRGLEARRYMMRRAIERNVVAPCVLANEQFETTPELRFHPTRIELSWDPAVAQLLIDLRDRGDLSRDSALGELDFDQEDEAVKRQREAEDFDHIFTPTNSPWAIAGKDTLVPPGPGGKPQLAPGADAPDDGSPGPSPEPLTPHSHAPDGSPVPLPPTAAGSKKPGARTSKTTMDPRSAGRNLGGNRRGGGAAPGSGQGQPPRTGRPKNT